MATSVLCVDVWERKLKKKKKERDEERCMSLDVSTSECVLPVCALFHPHTDLYIFHLSLDESA